MSLITTNTETVPDFKNEYHSVIVDTLNQTNKNTFTIHLQTPLENVVQARLLSAVVNTTTSNLCYVSVDELNSNFTQRGTSDLSGESTLSLLNRHFGVLTSGDGNRITFKDDYMIAQQYIFPIKKLDRMSFVLRDENGNTLAGSDDHFFVFKFVCAKENLA